MTESEWALRYCLKNQVPAILRAKEEYWRRRGGVKWVTKGDAKSGYFHAFANGRKRKSLILRLNSEDGLRLTQADIVRHIYDFFIGLLGTDEVKVVGLQEGFWELAYRASQVENDWLALAFLPEEIDRALAGM